MRVDQFRFVYRYAIYFYITNGVVNPEVFKNQSAAGNSTASQEAASMLNLAADTFDTAFLCKCHF